MMLIRSKPAARQNLLPLNMNHWGKQGPESEVEPHDQVGEPLRKLWGKVWSRLLPPPRKDNFIAETAKDQASVSKMVGFLTRASAPTRDSGVPQCALGLIAAASVFVLCAFEPDECLLRRTDKGEEAQ
jgi:hypothetical protein